MERISLIFSKIEVPEAPRRGSEESWAPKRVWRSGTDLFSIFPFLGPNYKGSKREERREKRGEKREERREKN